MRRLRRRLRLLLRRSRHEAEIAAEIDFHRDMTRRALQAQGLTPEEADAAAHKIVGSVTLAQDQVRDVWIQPWLQSVWQDGRFAARLLTRDWSFALIAALALALGVGVNSTQFAIVDAYCLRGLPIDHPERVAYITLRDVGNQEQGVSYAEVQDLRDAATSVTSLAAFATMPVALGDEGRPADRVEGAYISANAFPMIGVQPVLGRLFRADEEAGEGAAVVILGGGVWGSRYGADPGIIGRVIRLNGAPATVIGVMPERFTFPNHVGLWQPLARMPALTTQPRDARLLEAFGRLRDDRTMGQARAEAEEIVARLARAHPDATKGLRAWVVPINEHYNGRITDPAWLAFMTVGGLLVLIACANVANLLLMRSTSRAHEIAIRASLGATRGRIVRQLLIESTLLAALGSLLGLALAVAGLRFFVSVIPAEAVPYAGFAIDGRVLGVLMLVCLLTVFVFGLVPARHLSRIPVQDTLKDGARTASTGSRARRWTAVFLTAEFALTIILLAHVSWNVRLSAQTQRADLVIDPSPLLTMWITLPADRYATTASRAAFYTQLRERLAGLPSVLAVTPTTALPFSGGTPKRLAIDGRDTGDQPLPQVATLAVGVDYFRALGLPILQGRAFTAVDGTGTAAGLASGDTKAIVNQRFAELYFAGQSPIGHRIQLREDNPRGEAAGGNASTGAAAEAATPPAQAWLTIVGVSPTLRQRPRLEPDAVVYLPFHANPPATAALIVRTRTAPGALSTRVREEVSALDPDLPLDRVLTLDEAINALRWNYRISNGMVMVIAGIALALSMVGLYALTAYAVAQRLHEIGVRLALGAPRRAIHWLVLRRVLWQLGVGLTAGFLCTLGWTRLFDGPPQPGVDVGVTDPLTLLPVAVLLTLVALVASLQPMRRAARVDPVAALR
jgi:putative ABC transport system permease protein